MEIRPGTLELGGRDREEMLRDIDRYIRHYRAHVPPETGREGRIYLRRTRPAPAPSGGGRISGRRP